MSRVPKALSPHAVPLAVAATAFTLAVGLPAGDPDMWWQLASGRWMVEHRDGIRVDVFSSTATGEPYALGEWLGEVILYGAYATLGWMGVALLRAGLVAVAAFAVTRLALRGAPARVAIPVAALALLLSKPTWTDRPQLFTLALFPVLLDLCFAARGGSRAALSALVPLVALWSNAHGGYALGIAIVWIFAAEAVVERRPALGWLAAAAATTLLVSALPGALPLRRAAAHIAGPTVRIVEESPIDPLTPFGALFALFLGAMLLTLLLRGGTLLHAFVLVPMLGLALTAQRHVPLFGFAAVPLLAGPLTVLVEDVGTTLKRVIAGGVAADKEAGGSPSGLYVFPYQPGTDPYRPGTERHTRSNETPAGPDPATGTPAGPEPEVPPRPSSKSSFPLALAAALWLGALASIATVDPRPDLTPYPAKAVPALEASRGVLLNEYDWGGYLMWQVPSRPVFVDGRLFPFAGNGVMRQYQEAMHVLPSWRAVIERWNVAQALLRPDRALVQALRDDGWTVGVQDRDFVLLERPR